MHKNSYDRTDCYYEAVPLIRHCPDFMPGDAVMINFEEELAKFKPSLEVDETEKAILNDNMTDLTDILQELLEQTKK